ncbi:DUF4179 domain-containing protein [Bacillus sp. REN16]|uniref:DUF4179 domain-containing protein n=1 Tax=Bacillus sp. REN16 TaxID=2887296 RepID=UPI001E45BCA5|nr:DUF4179 domain-containing protein [Bacillus sp. REN16]MCC3356065.1 DUF4179 domain-containing protein [Bacillus sp. REN16]
MKCNDVQDFIVGYIEGILDEEDTVKVNSHLQTCETCQQEAKEIEQMIALIDDKTESIKPPDHFMKNVRTKVEITENNRRKKMKRTTIGGLVAALFLTLFVGTAVATEGFATFIDWYKDLSNKETRQVEQLIEQGLGEQLNLIAESNGIKVTIKSVVADDIQTLIYYEVEDLSKKQKFMINYSQGIRINNQQQFWKNQYLTVSDTPFNSSFHMYSNQNHVFAGRLGAMPMSEEEGVIKFQLNKVEKVVDDPSNPGTLGNDERGEFVHGDWYFEIPIKKHKAIVHELNIETEVDGNPVFLDELTIAPTTTILSYRYRDGHDDKKIRNIQIKEIESGTKSIYLDPLSGVSGSSEETGGMQRVNETFNSIYFDQPKELEIHFGAVSYFKEKPQSFTIDITKSMPQTFEYLNNKISIEEVEFGETTKIHMTEELSKNRQYEIFNYEILNENEECCTGSTIDVDGYIVDKDGEKYDAKEFYRMSELEQPRIFTTSHQIELFSNKVENLMLKIDGYTTTTFIDETINVTLD